MTPKYLSANFLLITEEDTYGFLAIMATSKRSKYLFLSKMQLEVASVTAYELSKQYCVSMDFTVWKFHDFSITLI